MTQPPAVSSGRWRPLRLGLIDMFYYDQQEFWFRDGRLMLLGNNGTGKSKVLALTLPLLLDADMSAYRVEPDGDPKKQMQWNLLLGGRHDDRLGYTWMEFGRRDADGREHHLTIGIGLKAVTGRGIAEKWFFVTTRRMGVDLSLISPEGTALTRDRLIEAIGTTGQVTQTAATYRRLVDERLFHLGEDRYESLVDLLIQLRQPQLSKKPDPTLLSAALSDALTPVKQDVLADVAEAFHEQAEQREELAGLRLAAEAAARFDETYRRYARIATQRQAGRLREAHSGYEQRGRDISALNDIIEAADNACAAAEARLEEIDAENRAATARSRQLSGRAELADVESARSLAASARKAYEIADEAAEDARRVHREADRRRNEAVDRAGESRSAVASAFDTVATLADQSMVTRRHRELCAPFADPAAPAEPQALRDARRSGADLADARDQGVTRVLDLNAEVARREAEVTALAAALADREAQQDTAADELGRATRELSTARDEHVRSWRTRDMAELRLPDPDEVGLHDWTETLHGPNPATAAAQETARAMHRDLEREAARIGTRLAREREHHAELSDEQDALLAGRTRRPPEPYTRGSARDDRLGAPLWKVVDFQQHLDIDARAGLEAAMEAAGLLDAWITPDGKVLATDVLDDALVAGGVEAVNLTEVLRPAIDPDDPSASAVSPGVVTGLLRSIGLGRGGTWIAADGRYRIGTRHGRWTKAHAEYLGHTAREQATQRRLLELEADLIASAEAIAAHEAALAAVRDGGERLDADMRDLPSDQELRDAHTKVALTKAELTRCELKVTEQHGLLTAGRERRHEAAERRDETAADLGLPTGDTELGDVRTAVQRYRVGLGELWSALERHADRLTMITETRRQSEDATEALDRTVETAGTAKADHLEAEERLHALLDQLGGTVDDLLREIADLEERLKGLRAEQGRVDKTFRDKQAELHKAQGRRDQLQEQQAEAVARRDEAVAALRDFTTTGLLAVAVPGVEVPDTAREWAPNPTVQLARRIGEALSDVDVGDDAWQRAQNNASNGYTAFGDAVSKQGLHATAEMSHECYVVSVVYRSKICSPGELARLLNEDIDFRDRLLNAKERELLEEHLVKEVARHLQELIHAAEDQVREMNAELDERPTSTGMKLRMRWGPAKEVPEGFAAVRTLLRKESGLWSPQDEKRVSTFLHERIRQEAEEHPEDTWQTHLENALDYRRWHRFLIDRHQDGAWRDAVGPASGGERVLTVSLPLFAAASSHYRSAHEHAPRLIMLDEAFAGVDDDSRAKCLGLLANFDMDVAMTSEREWGFYTTVPGIRTHQLVRRDGIDAVFVNVFEWDGRERRRVDVSAGPPTPPPTDPDQPTLM